MSSLETHSALRPQVYRPLTLLALNPQTPNTSALSKNERLFLSTAVPSLELHKTANLEICGRILAKIYLVTFSKVYISKRFAMAKRGFQKENTSSSNPEKFNCVSYLGYCIFNLNKKDHSLIYKPPPWACLSPLGLLIGD